METVGQNYRQNYGYHERRQAIAICEYLQTLQQSQINYQELGQAIASALLEKTQPLEERRNLSLSKKCWGRFFYASQQPGQVVEVLHQSLATATQNLLWILLYDQSSGAPDPNLEPRVVGCIGKGSLASNGNAWGYNYGKGLVFQHGILACLSLSEFGYQPPDYVELSVSVKFYGIPASNKVYDFAPLLPTDPSTKAISDSNNFNILDSVNSPLQPSS